MKILFKHLLIWYLLIFRWPKIVTWLVPEWEGTTRVNGRGVDIGRENNWLFFAIRPPENPTWELLGEITVNREQGMRSDFFPYAMATDCTFNFDKKSHQQMSRSCQWERVHLVLHRTLIIFLWNHFRAERVWTLASLVASCCAWANRGPERLTDQPKSTQLPRSKAESQTQTSQGERWGRMGVEGTEIYSQSWSMNKSHFFWRD